MHLILTGATGLVGSGALDAMLKMTDISKISILSRRPVPMAEKAQDPRVNVIIHKDFGTYDSELLKKIQDANGVVWALGISQTKVSAEEYVKITKDYTLSAAKAFATLPRQDPASPFRFIYVSGHGASLDPGRFTQIFARVKGETELALDKLRAENTQLATESVRPAFVDWQDHDAIKPFLPPQPLWIRGVGAGLRATMNLAFKDLHNPTEPLGRFLAEMAMGKHEKALEESEGKPEDVVRADGGMRIVAPGGVRRLMGLT